MRPRLIRDLLVAVDALAALPAIGGGIALVAGLESFPPEWLEGTPFESYLVPGLILAVVVGGSAAVAAVTLLRSPHAGALASIAAGVIMIGWIGGEILILNQPSRPAWIEVVFLIIGLAMVGLGLALRRVTAPLSQGGIR